MTDFDELFDRIERREIARRFEGEAGEGARPDARERAFRDGAAWLRGKVLPVLQRAQHDLYGRAELAVDTGAMRWRGRAEAEPTVAFRLRTVEADEAGAERLGGPVFQLRVSGGTRLEVDISSTLVMVNAPAMGTFCGPLEAIAPEDVENLVALAVEDFVRRLVHRAP